MAGLRQREKGFTLVEMLVTLTILAILASAIMPIAKTAVKREKEIELRRNLRLLREALDAYKKLADEKTIEVEEDSEGYPPDLETLVKGVEVKAEQAQSQTPFGQPTAKSSSEKKIVKFLRRIPRDPMTGSIDWGLRSYQDEPDTDDWGGENVYDIYTKSPGTALDGTKYRDW
ncbi:MAG TPA: general secretion pathway protein GspG [Candidatus Aminicenantes bacterium]|nr:general secretion pathway protein GspG [Candidatus Aminicenantes bacterium]